MSDYKVIDNSGHGKWAQPCSVVVNLTDLDAAHALAKLLGASLKLAAGGGDLLVSGHHIGHDVTGTVTLVKGCEKPE